MHAVNMYKGRGLEENDEWRDRSARLNFCNLMEYGDSKSWQNTQAEI